MTELAEFPEPPTYRLDIRRDQDTALWLGDLYGGHRLSVPLLLRARTIAALYESAVQYGTRCRCYVDCRIVLPVETKWYVLQLAVAPPKQRTEWKELLVQVLRKLGLESDDIAYFVNHAEELAALARNATEPPTEDQHATG